MDKRITWNRKMLFMLFAAALLAALSGAIGFRAGASLASPVTLDYAISTDDAVRARLLAEAMDYVGVCSPEAAAEVWAQGLMRRSAAMQYAVMDDDLKARYEKALETTAPNWVTGVSSPWVSQYAIISQEDTHPGTVVLTLDIDTATSSGPAQTLHAVLTVAYHGGFWRISSIQANEALSAYTGFPVSLQ